MASTYRSPRHAEQVRHWCRAALLAWSVPHQTHHVDTSLGRTHIVSLGAGDRVIVYLPGTNFNASTSLVALEALAGQFRVYAADLPGQPGLSAAARPRHEVSGYAQWFGDVVSWIQALEPDARIVVVGHSRGAAVAMSADPDTVDAVALLSPAGLIDVRPTHRMLRATLPWLLQRNEAGARRLLQYMSGPGHSPPPRLVEWMTLVARTCRTTGAPNPYPDAVVSNWQGRNVLVIVGDHDVFFPLDRLGEVCRYRLGTDPVVVERAGHLLLDEEAGRVTNLIADLV